MANDNPLDSKSAPIAAMRGLFHQRRPQILWLASLLLLFIFVAGILWQQAKLTNQAAALQTQLQTNQEKLTQQVAQSQVQESRIQTLENSLAAASNQSEAWQLLNLEQALELVNQKLLLFGNVNQSIALLELAQQRLAQSTSPRLIGLQVRLKQEIQTLRTQAIQNDSALFTRIDQLQLRLNQIQWARALPSKKTAQSNGPEKSLWQRWLGIFEPFFTLQPVAISAPAQLTELELWNTLLHLHLTTARTALLSQQLVLARDQLNSAVELVSSQANLKQAESRAIMNELADLLKVIKRLRPLQLELTLTEIRNLRLSN